MPPSTDQTRVTEERPGGAPESPLISGQQPESLWAGAYFGTFLLAAGFLFVEILATRVIGFVVGMESVYSTIAVAMLGMGVAGSAVSLFRRTLEPREAASRAAWLCVAASIGTLLIFVSGRLWQDHVNGKLDVLLQHTNQDDFMSHIVLYGREGAAVLGLAMAVSYFLYGAALAFLFRACSRKSLHRLYAADLSGACAGALLSILALEYGGFTPPLVLAAAIPLVAAASLVYRGSRGRAVALLGLAVVVGGVLSVGSVSALLEPRPHMPTLGRAWPEGQYAGAQVQELWHQWTSYGRIGVARAYKPGLREDSDERYFVTHGRGEGHALILDARNPQDDYELPVAAALSANPAKRILVLLAGAGRDMAVVNQLTGGNFDELVGVELIPQSLIWPLSMENQFHLQEFFSNPKVHMNIAEAREFLARDQSKYDCILVSWFGHSLSYYTGMAAGSVGFLYSVEGVRSMLNHLSPGGELTILNGNKSRLIATALAADRNSVGTQRVVIVGEKDDPQPWYSTEDGKWLLVKPSGFTPEDVAGLKDLVKADRKLEYYPGMKPDPQNAYYEFLSAPDGPKWLKTMAANVGVDMTPATDDWPFAESFVPLSALFAWHAPKDPPVEGQLHYWRTMIVDTIKFSAVSLCLILAPLLVRQRGRIKASGIANHMVYFASLGAGFMLVEIGLVQKFRLLVGHPGYTIAVVLASLILFTGMGSAISGPLFARGILNFRRAGLLAGIASVAVLVLFEAVTPLAVGLPRPVKLLIAFLLPALPGLVLGQLYPQGLARIPREMGSLVPWAMAINAAAGTIAAAAGVVLGYAFGFTAVVLMGACFYLLVAMMPHGPRQRVPQS
jgi:hypothetical protein